MKKILLSFIFLAVIAGCSSSKKAISVGPNEHMEVGWTPRAVFQSPLYAVWFDSCYNSYTPQAEYIEQLKQMKDSVALLVIYGIWCSDSRHELPRFYKMVDAIGFPPDKITLIAVDRTMKIPAGIADEYRITNVPTFILKYRGIEIGRVIESPRTTLEQDFTELLKPLFP